MKWLAVLAGLGAVGCATTSEGGSGACSAESLDNLVGREATSELGADALRQSGARQLRWIRPGDAVTMDYRPDRLNVRLDASGRVEAFNCG